MTAVRGLAEVVLSVRDLETSVRFYRDVLGLPIISPDGLPGAVFFGVGDTGAVQHQLVLALAPSGTPEFPTTRAHRLMRHYAIEIAPDAFETERQRLHNLGVEVRTGEHPFLPLKALYIDDPDGNEIELVTRK